MQVGRFIEVVAGIVHDSDACHYRRSDGDEPKDCPQHHHYVGNRERRHDAVILLVTRCG